MSENVTVLTKEFTTTLISEGVSQTTKIIEPDRVVIVEKVRAGLDGESGLMAEAPDFALLYEIGKL